MSRTKQTYPAPVTHICHVTQSGLRRAKGASGLSEVIDENIKFAAEFYYANIVLFLIIEFVTGF